MTPSTEPEKKSHNPHPEERSSSRPRIADPRPPQPEPDAEADEGGSVHQPEVERAFDLAASRSRDNSPHGPNWSGEGEDSENGESKGAAQDGHLINGADLDEVHHDLTAHERREARLRNLLHIMTIKSNNLEMHLHALTLRHRRAATLPQIIELYTHQAPSLDPPGTYAGAELFGTTTSPDGIPRFFIQERHLEHGDTELTFLSQTGLIQCRNRRVIYRADWRMSTADRVCHLHTIYEGLHLVQ